MPRRKRYIQKTPTANEEKKMETAGKKNVVLSISLKFPSERRFGHKEKLYVHPEKTEKLAVRLASS